jgi:hypothetical protein
MLSRLRATVRALGAADALLYLTSRVLRGVSLGHVRLVKYYFVAQPVAPAVDAPGAASARMRMHVLAQPDPLLGATPRAPQVLQARFAQGARCVLAERDGEFAGFIWLCPAPYREDDVRCTYRWTPASLAAWDFDVLVAPPFRLGRLFMRMWERAHALLYAEGARWTLSRIDAFNAGSLAAHRKLGARDLGRGWFLVIGPAQLACFTVAPYCHFAWRPGRDPQLHFDLDALGPQTSASPPRTRSASGGAGR